MIDFLDFIRVRKRRNYAIKIYNSYARWQAKFEIFFSNFLYFFCNKQRNMRNEGNCYIVPG